MRAGTVSGSQTSPKADAVKNEASSPSPLEMSSPAQRGKANTVGSEAEPRRSHWSRPLEAELHRIVANRIPHSAGIGLQSNSMHGSAGVVSVPLSGSETLLPIDDTPGSEVEDL